MAKKPATESTFAQGEQESPNPFRSDTKPPSVLQPADPVLTAVSRVPCPGSVFLIKVIKDG